MTNKSLLDALLRARLLEEPAYEALLKEAAPRNDRAWLSGRLLAAGTGLVLAGVICFFAANWRDLGTLLKLGLPLLGLLACGAGAFYKRLETGAGQAFAFGAAVLTGVFLAVFGQVYQSGAFVYEFFGLWAVLLVPLAAAARNKWLWLLTLYTAGLYWLNKYKLGVGVLHSNELYWSLFVGGFLLAWAAAVWKRCGAGFERFIWAPLSVFTWCTGVAVAVHFTQGDIFYVVAAFLVAAGALAYALRRKDAVLFGWNALALAGLCVSVLLDVLHLSFFGLLVYALFYLAAGLGTYVFWRAHREER